MIRTLRVHTLALLAICTLLLVMTLSACGGQHSSQSNGNASSTITATNTPISSFPASTQSTSQQIDDMLKSIDNAQQDANNDNTAKDIELQP